jgi:TRAP transporter TAXI family solute receptor
MAMRYGFAILAVLAFWLSGEAKGAEPASQRLLILGSGGVTGFYYPAAGAVCRTVNLTRKQTGLRCLVESTAGSVNNLHALKTGELDLAIVQSSWLYHAIKGSNVFIGEPPNQNLRVLFALHGEPLTIFGREAAGVSKLADLKGKRINIGRKGTALRMLVDSLFDAMSWATADFKAVLELDADEQMTAICEKRIDAAFYVIAHPISIVQDATKCGAKFIPVEGPVIQSIVTKSPYFAKISIPPGMYPELPKGLSTFGVKAFMVATTRLPEDIAYDVTKAVFDDFKRFTHQHPVLEQLKKEELARDIEVAPMHDGARRYFLGAGFLK